MAWTAVGGKILIIETAKSKGKGKIEVTGHLGDVMKESVRTAIGWIKSNNERLRAVQKALNSDQSNNSDDKLIFEDTDIHIHFPAAAIPKDGPSADITITVALVK